MEFNIFLIHGMTVRQQKYLFNFFFTDFFFFLKGAVGIAQAGSPTRDRGSPLPMDENKSRQSPCMLDPQSGSSRAMFSMTEQEEVKINFYCKIKI